MNERLSLAQQENILTLLCYHDEYGKLVANLVDPALFEGDYREVAIRVTDYWRLFKKAPKLHTSDLFTDILEEPRDPRSDTFRRIIMNMAHMNEGLNTEYVISSLQRFIRTRKLMEAILRAAEVLQRRDASTSENIERIEKVLSEVLKARDLFFDRGTRLDDDLEPFLDYLERHHREFITGLKSLDDNNIVPSRGELFLLLAGKGRGKSWWLINLGKHAIRFGKKVLHISLENSEMETRLRYYQALFAVPRWRMESIEFPVLDFNARGNMEGIANDWRTPAFSMQSVELRSELETRLTETTVSYMARNLIIKRFPNRSLTVEGLEAYLDSLEQGENFIPDLLLVDYPKLMKPSNPKDIRQSLRENTEKLRAVAVERNLAVAIVDQLNRKGHDSGMATSTHVGEDWSQVHTADITITHSATDAERSRGLARLFVDHARSSKDKQWILITQSLDAGQFVLDSVELPQNYYEEIQPKRGEGQAEAEEEEIADDEAA